MIVAIGVDLVETRRIALSLERFGSRLEHKLLTVAEQRADQSAAQLSAYLSRQFAGKEAVSKVLGTGMRSGVHFRNIEILRDKTGAPSVNLIGAAKDRAKVLGIDRIHISLSDEKAYALAYAVGESLPD